MALKSGSIDAASFTSIRLVSRTVALLRACSGRAARRRPAEPGKPAQASGYLLIRGTCCSKNVCACAYYAASGTSGGTSGGADPMNFNEDLDRETDGRWIAEVADLPGVLAYGETRERALAAAQALA